MNKPNYKERFSLFFQKAIWLFKNAILFFIRDDCSTKASTLTYYTLQSIVPLLAFTIAFAKGFGLEEFLEKQLGQLFAEQQKILEFAIRFANSTLSQITSGVVIGFGIALLLWSCISLFGYIETAFNQIWKIRRERNTAQKIRDFSFILIVGPLCFLVSSGLTVFLQSGFKVINPYIPFGSYLSMLLKLAPALLFSSLFFILYALIPNTSIRPIPRLLAALITGLLFQLWQIFYINFQVLIFNYNPVYGTFSIVPLFLIWLQFSWSIILFGAEIAATIENRSFLAFSERHKQINKKELGVLLLYQIFKAFYHNRPSLTNYDLSKQLKVPLNQTLELLDQFVEKGILSIVKNETREPSYLPAGDPEKYTLKMIVDSIDSSLDIMAVVENSHGVSKIIKLLHALDKEENKSQHNVTLKEICCD